MRIGATATGIGYAVVGIFTPSSVSTDAPNPELADRALWLGITFLIAAGLPCISDVVGRRPQQYLVHFTAVDERGRRHVWNVNDNKEPGRDCRNGRRLANQATSGLACQTKSYGSGG